MSQPDTSENPAPAAPEWVRALPAAVAAEVAAARADLPTTAAAAGEALPAAIAAWLLLDPAPAARLLAEWLATQDDRGCLHPAVPVACQLAERIAAVLPNAAEWLATILPALGRSITEAFSCFDPRNTGLPRWDDAASALLPETFMPRGFGVDLAVLLANETAAFLRLANDRADLGDAINLAEGEMRELDGWLRDNFWDEEAGAFLALDEHNRATPDWSPRGFFPLVWRSATEEMNAGLRARAADVLRQTWTPRAWLLLFVLLLPTTHGSIVAQMRRQGLPDGATVAERAAWTVLSHGADAARARYQQDISRPARWLDAHARQLWRALAVGGLAALILLLGWGYHQRHRAAATPAELEQQARLACAEDQHEAAAALYARAAQQGDTAYFLYRQAGEWFHAERFAEAEAVCRDILRREPDSPNVRFNLPLAVLKQGRREEALAMYRALADELAISASPELAARAQLAAELLARQIELDQPADR